MSTPATLVLVGPAVPSPQASQESPTVGERLALAPGIVQEYAGALRFEFADYATMPEIEAAVAARRDEPGE